MFPEEMMIVAPYGHAPIARASEVNRANVYAFRANCSYRRHFESWFHADRATPGRIHEMESYHGMLACVIAGAGLALIPRSMLESMPGHQQVSARPLAEEWRWLTTAGVASGRQNPPAGSVYSAAERRSANSGFSIKTLSGSGW